jgi:hypothetical protein
MKILLFIVGFFLLCLLCWPLAVLALLLFPIVWLLLLPFRLVAIVLSSMLALIEALLFLPARLLGFRKCRC